MLTRTECPECGSSDTSWNCSQYTKTDVQDGRLRLNEVSTRFYLGCNVCLETIRTISGDKVAALLNGDD